MSTLVFDIDGVFADFNEGYNKLLGSLHGKDLKTEDNWPPKEWNWETPLGYSAETQKAAWDRIVKSKDFWLELPYLPKAYETLRFLNRLSKTGKADIYFITNRIGYQAKYQTEQWLYNCAMEYPTVIIVNDWKAKLPLISTLNASFFIDDKLETVENVASHVSSGIYLHDAGYNRVGRTGKYKVAENAEKALQEAGIWV